VEKNKKKMETDHKNIIFFQNGKKPAKVDRLDNKTPINFRL